MLQPIILTARPRQMNAKEGNHREVLPDATKATDGGGSSLFYFDKNSRTQCQLLWMAPSPRRAPPLDTLPCDYNQFAYLSLDSIVSYECAYSVKLQSVHYYRALLPYATTVRHYRMPH